LKEIKLTQGKVALVDDEDFDRLSAFKWHARKDDKQPFYAVRMDYSYTPKKMVKMHRFILGVTDPKKVVDHINHDTLDNQKANIRACRIAENTLNTTSKKNSTSKYLGVSRSKKCKSWVAQIQKDKKNIYLGSFKIEEHAAEAYNKAAAELFGEFANPNKIAI